MQGALLFAIPWSFSAVTEGDSREKFDRFYRDLVTGHNENFHIPDSITKLEGLFPDVGLVQDFCFEVCWHLLESLCVMKLILIIRMCITFACLS